ncbi:MAG: acetamidase/formamidase family protein [Eubacteriales bacterium]|nr:acetamidase/formamidase family protein [Eubacteriales bacterium]
MQRVENTNVIYNFTPDMKPVQTVGNGDIIRFESNDCFYQQVLKNTDVLEEIDQDRLNPATGPVYIEGAEPGDILKVDILSIDIAESGCSAVVPGHGILPDEAKEAIVRIIPIKDGHADYLGLHIPVKPMIGVIGVAPAAADGSWPTATPWKHGGNMDTHDIRVGSSLYFDVAQKGALFALGDCHAIMGDGEVCFTGLEIPAEVTVRLTVIKDQKNIGWPFLETEEEIMVIGSGDNIEAACRAALSPMVRALSNFHNISWEEAYILSSLVVDLKISQLVDPKLTARAVISKHYLTAEGFLASL